jgi:hypothetical protein
MSLIGHIGRVSRIRDGTTLKNIERNLVFGHYVRCGEINISVSWIS